MNVKNLEYAIAELIRKFEKDNKSYYIDSIELRRFVLLTGEGGMTLNVKVKLGKWKELYKNL